MRNRAAKISRGPGDHDRPLTEVHVASLGA
jgi:hypothetical protein